MVELGGFPPRQEIEGWSILSEAGQVCGIWGCPKDPVKECQTCRHWYCEEHFKIHQMCGHLGRKS